MAQPSLDSSVSTPILKGDPRTHSDQFETTSKKTFATPHKIPQKLEPIKVSCSNFFIKILYILCFFKYWMII